MKQYLKSEIALREKQKIMKDFLEYLPDPDYILKQQGKGIEIYRKLELDPHFTAVKQQRVMQVTSMDWEVTPSTPRQARGSHSETGGNTQGATEIESWMRSIEIETVIEQILDCLFYGFTVFEIIWKELNGKIVPDRIIEKPQEWFVFDENNELRMRPERITEKLIELPPYKFLVARHKAKYDNPYGEKLLARCFWPVKLKKDGIVFWSYMAEKFGMPYLIGKVSKNATNEDKAAFLKELESMRRDAVAVCNDDDSIETLDIGSRGDSNTLYSDFINFQNTEISKAVLTVTLTTEVQKNGAYAASQTHKEILDQLALADKKIVEKTVNELIRWYVELNWGSGKEIPTFLLKHNFTATNQQQTLK
jgi:phage gp29-like protein